MFGIIALPRAKINIKILQDFMMKKLLAILAAAALAPAAF